MRKCSFGARWALIFAPICTRDCSLWLSRPVCISFSWSSILAGTNSGTPAPGTKSGTPALGTTLGALGTKSGIPSPGTTLGIPDPGTTLATPAPGTRLATPSPGTTLGASGVSPAVSTTRSSSTCSTRLQWAARRVAKPSDILRVLAAVASESHSSSVRVLPSPIFASAPDDWAPIAPAANASEMAGLLALADARPMRMLDCCLFLPAVEDPFVPQFVPLPPLPGRMGCSIIGPSASTTSMCSTTFSSWLE